MLMWKMKKHGERNGREFWWHSGGIANHVGVSGGPRRLLLGNRWRCIAVVWYWSVLCEALRVALCTTTRFRMRGAGAGTPL
jgi:hypothetical protein